MAFQESLRLRDRFEPTHASFSNSGRPMCKLCSIVGVLFCVVVGAWDQSSVFDAIASQFVCDDLSWHIACF